MGSLLFRAKGREEAEHRQSANEERWRYKKSGTWKYDRGAEFQIQSPFVHEVKELRLVGIGKQRIKLWVQLGSTFSSG